VAGLLVNGGSIYQNNSTSALPFTTTITNNGSFRLNNGAIEMCDVKLCCTPKLTEPALAALAERINKLLVPVPRPSPPQPEPEPVPKEKKPWWKVW
jgi:hypothetical protein